jgi:hypothetical protein
MPIDFRLMVCQCEFMKPYLSANEFARIVKRDTKTVIRWVKKGWIPGAKRVGYVYQIPSKQVDAYQQSVEYPPKEWRK